jgi:hypothetical protein
MAQSNAERQATYRARHLKGIDGTGERINLLVDIPTKRALERLAACYGVTQRAMLQTLIASAERAMLDTLPPDEQAKYYNPAPKGVTQ